jgi:hypothetical protein
MLILLVRRANTMIPHCFSFLPNSIDGKDTILRGISEGISRLCTFQSSSGKFWNKSGVGVRKHRVAAGIQANRILNRGTMELWNGLWNKTNAAK